MKTESFAPEVSTHSVDQWSNDELHLFWFGDGTKHNRGLVGDALRWLCYRPSPGTELLVMTALNSPAFEKICAAFGYSPEFFIDAAKGMIARRIGINDRNSIH